MRILAVLLATIALLSCERENRRFREVASTASTTPVVMQSELRAGGGAPDETIDHPYLRNAWAMSEGKRLFSWMNCAGCHSPNGGGAMGPPLSDEEWIYGVEPENIFATISGGRPNGMPAFGGKLSNQQIWQLVAYVRTLSGLQRKDVKPSRSDAMMGKESEIRRPPREPRPSTTPPASVQP
jgi:cytochrome c oxidase cbb3-type subunit III